MSTAFYSEESPPTEFADLLSYSLPLFSAAEIFRRTARFVATLDKDILDPLHKIGFRTNLGYDDTGIIPMVLDKCGGYYFGMFLIFFF